LSALIAGVLTAIIVVWAYAGTPEDATGRDPGQTNTSITPDTQGPSHDADPSPDPGEQSPTTDQTDPGEPAPTGNKTDLPPNDPSSGTSSPDSPDQSDPSFDPKEGPEGRRRGQVRLVRVAGAAVAVLLILGVSAALRPPVRVLGEAALLSRMMNRSEVKVELLDARARGEALNVLVIGSDRRDVTFDHLPGVGRLAGKRADAVMIWRLEAHQRELRVMSIPRDVRVSVRGRGEHKLSGAYAYGATAAVQAVRDLTELPLHHVIEVDFVGLIRAVDQLGGVEITLHNAMRDRYSDLRLRAGKNHLDGAAALALLRSRHPEVLHGTQWIPLEAGDAARVRRQQVLLRRLIRTANEMRPSVARAVFAMRDVGRHISFDSAWTGYELRGLLGRLGEDVTVSVVSLPVHALPTASEQWSPFPPLHAGSTGFREMRQPYARRMLAHFQKAEER
jgi:LCP family protein required for cell wall assembly